MESLNSDDEPGVRLPHLEGVEGTEPFDSGDEAGVALALLAFRGRTASLPNDRLSGGGDASGVLVLFLLGVCTGFVSLVPLWKPGGSGLGDAVVFTLARP